LHGNESLLTFAGVIQKIPIQSQTSDEMLNIQLGGKSFASFNVVPINIFVLKALETLLQLELNHFYNQRLPWGQNFISFFKTELSLLEHFHTSFI
jgi:hypothetical protein